jgi:hypothetical protein
MIKVKLEKNKSGKIIFKLKIDEKYEDNVLFKRALMESKILKGKSEYDYEVPLRFFMPIFNNIQKENLILDKKSILSYLEFSDCYDQNYYTDIEATAKYMKKWIEEACPDIYRVTIDQNNYNIKKEVAFKRPRIEVNYFNL